MKRYATWGGTLPIVMVLSVLTVMGPGCRQGVIEPDVEFNPITLGECPAEVDEATELDVNGTYEYSGFGENETTGIRFRLSGSVTLEQEEDMVRVVRSDYDGLELRSVSSDFAPLEGNMVFLSLVSSEEGETEETRYEAETMFLFSEDGDEFCVGYTDSNNDGGELGSFVGRRM